MRTAVVRLTIVASGLSLLTAGCADTSTTSGEPVPPSAMPTTTTTPSVQPPPSPPPTPSGPWAWRTILTQALDGSIVPVYDGRHLVTSTDFVAGGTDLTVKDTSTGKIVTRYDTPAAYAVQGVWLSGRWMVVEETEYEPKRFDIRLYRFDLQTGTIDRLHTNPKVPRATEPQMQAAGNVLAYTGDDDAGQQCMHRLAIDTLAVQQAGCVPPGSVLGDPAVGPDGAITYSRVDAPNSAKRCKRLFHWPAGAAQPTAVTGVRGCAQWSGAVVAGGTVWTEVEPTKQNVVYARGFTRTADGTRTDLGLTVTGTIEPCAGWVYWKAPANGRDGGPEAIYRWKPGIAQPETVFAPPKTDAVLSPPSCAGPYITVRLDRIQPPAAVAQTHLAS